MSDTQRDAEVVKHCEQQPSCDPERDIPLSIRENAKKNEKTTVTPQSSVEKSNTKNIENETNQIQTSTDTPQRIDTSGNFLTNNQVDNTLLIVATVAVITVILLLTGIFTKLSKLSKK